MTAVKGRTTSLASRKTNGNFTVRENPVLHSKQVSEFYKTLLQRSEDVGLLLAMIDSEHGTL
jgi:hypothetical protein